MSPVVQMLAPKAELVEQPKVRLAYTRKDGWIVVTHRPQDHGLKWYARPGGKGVWEGEVLAWADLPPVPENAA